jgi:hypothetical protein
MGRSSSTGFSHSVFGNVGELIEKFLLTFGDGITSESHNIADEGDAVMSDSECEKSGNVPLVAFVETLKQ